MATQYVTRDQWASKKGYANWAAYDKSYPTQADLEDYLDEMTDTMNSEQYINTTTSITDTRYLKFLRRVCYNGVNYMMSEEEAMAGERVRTVRQYIDYMRPSHRKQLIEIGRTKGTRVFGAVR